MQVTKRNNEIEDYDVEKIHKVVQFAIDGLNGVSLSDIEMNADISLYDKIRTTDIHQLLIKSASDLISTSNPNYQYVAARLLLMSIRKQVWGHDKTPPSLLHHIQINVDNGIYEDSILEKWTPEQINKIGSFISHDRDALFTYGGLQQLVDKYLLKHRTNGTLYETPQFAYILIAMCLCDDVKAVKSLYDQISTFKVNLPTPIMCGVRSPKKQSASCVLIDVDDTLDSIFSSVTATGKYTANRAGIGLNIGRMRPINSTIRGGEVIHTGVIPFLKVFESTVKSTSQNAIRGGSANVSIPWWHYEIEEVMQLKNNAGTDDNRVRKLDYTVQFEELFYERLIKNQDITLFSPHEATGLYDSFGMSGFRDSYEKLEKSDTLKFKKSIPARRLAEIFARERLETARIYSMNIDNCNKHGSWNIPVKMTNLCVEVTHPTIPISSADDPNGEIGVCVLSAVNLLECSNERETEAACRSIIRYLEYLIDYQDYPFPAAENFTKNRRSLGVGVTNLFGLLAKSKLKYDTPEALALVHEKMEAIQYYLLDESCVIASEKGPCNRFNDTKYYHGGTPIDWYKRTVDDLTPPNYKMDWDALKAKIAKHGLRHSTMSCIMPCESSSVIQNSTNGIEPPRNLLSYKKSKTGILKTLVPNLYNRKYYTLAMDTNNKDIINMSAVIQKFVDMAMSTNLYYDYSKYEGGSVPLSEIIKDQLYGYKYGIKNLYYCVTPDGDGQFEQNIGCESGACTL